MSHSPLVAAAFAAFALAAAPALADPVKIVAAENFYGDVASQIGGAERRGDQHPQQPRPGPASVRSERRDAARALADAKIVIVNGADYDPWMEKLLGAHQAPGRKEIVVAAAGRPQEPATIRISGTIPPP